MATMLLMCLLFFSDLSSAFEVLNVTRPFYAHEQDAVRLSCRSDSYYEFCVWRHNSELCEFEWKREHNAVKSNRCSMDNVSFDGDYEKHECAIVIHKLNSKHTGTWSCEMQDYVIGPFRGASDKKFTKLAVLPQLKSMEDNVSTSINVTQKIDDDAEEDNYGTLEDANDEDDEALQSPFNDMSDNLDTLEVMLEEEEEESPVSWTSITLMLGVASLATVLLVALAAFSRRRHRHRMLNKNVCSELGEDEDTDDVERSLRARVELNDMLEEKEHNPSVNGMAYNGSKTYLDNK